MSPTTEPQARHFEIPAEATEVICLSRINGQMNIGGDHTTLRAFMILCHDANDHILEGDIATFVARHMVAGNGIPSELPLTQLEHDTLTASIRLQVMIREEVAPFENEKHLEFRGMRIVVCPDAETKRREMIES